LDHLKAWLGARQGAFTERARAFGLPSPKGMFLVGVPGCGKSLLAKATATAFSCPLLRADFGGAQSKWVGESQENIRRVFKLAETIGKCVLWVDEIEKALAGATSGAADGGVSADALGAFLSWMQERRGQVFVIATANDVSKLPPELLRKGRFDEMFFVDLPSKSEAREILSVSLRKFGRDPSSVDVNAVAAACEGFTGSEIDAIIPDALFTAFADGERALTTDDLLTAARAVTPLSRTAADKINGLREWSKGKARPASRLDSGDAQKSTIEFLDLDA
jgi:SpoVK/Ycf46/Vps4 family AAA+-type ATPase